MNPFGDNEIDFPTRAYLDGSVAATANVLTAGAQQQLPSGVKVCPGAAGSFFF